MSINVITLVYIANAYIHMYVCTYAMCTYIQTTSQISSTNMQCNHVAIAIATYVRI